MKQTVISCDVTDVIKYDMLRLSTCYRRADPHIGERHVFRRDFAAHGSAAERNGPGDHHMRPVCVGPRRLPAALGAGTVSLFVLWVRWLALLAYDSAFGPDFAFCFKLCFRVRRSLSRLSSSVRSLTGGPRLCARTLWRRAWHPPLQPPNRAVWSHYEPCVLVALACQI